MAAARRTLRYLTLVLLIGTASSCIVDTTGGAECTPDRNCVRNDDGTVECELGYRWEDEANADNFNCVPDVPDAGPAGS